MESLLRLSSKFIVAVLHARPDDRLEIQTPIEETIKQPINLVPISPTVKVERWLDILRQGATQIEHKVRERERSDSWKIFPEGCYNQSGRVGRWDMEYNGSERPVFPEPEAGHPGDVNQNI